MWEWASFFGIILAIIAALPVIFALGVHVVRLFGRWVDWVYMKLRVHSPPPIPTGRPPRPVPEDKGEPR